MALCRHSYCELNFIISLKKDAYLVVRLLDALVGIVPEGVTITNLKYKDKQVAIVGYASSNLKITELMRAIRESVYFVSPNLTEFSMKARHNQNQRTFQISFDLVKEGA